MLFVIPAAADDTPLAKQMEILNDAYKAIKKEQDPAKGAALAKEAQDAMVKAILELPEMVKAMPEGPDKAKASAEYRKMMGTLISALADMELAFHNKDLEKVKTIVEQLRESKKQGHDKFMDEDEWLIASQKKPARMILRAFLFGRIWVKITRQLFSSQPPTLSKR